MNKVKIGIIFALLSGALFLAGFNAMAAQSVSGTITVEAPLPSVPAEMYTLKVIDQKISKEHAQQITERLFGIRGEVIDKGNAWFIKNETKEIVVYKHGAIKYLDAPEVWCSKHPAGEMPNEIDAKLTAQKFIHRLADEGLLRREIIPAALEIERDIEVIAYRNSIMENYVLNVHVNSPLSYNNIPLHGAGAKLRVYLTKGSEVVGLLNFVGNLEPDKKVAVLSPEEAIEKLRGMGYGSSKIESIEFVYDVPSPSEMPKGIIPVYIFKGTMFAKDGSALKFVQVVLAVKNQ